VLSDLDFKIGTTSCQRRNRRTVIAFTPICVFVCIAERILKGGQTEVVEVSRVVAKDILHKVNEENVEEDGAAIGAGTCTYLANF